MDTVPKIEERQKEVFRHLLKEAKVRNRAHLAKKLDLHAHVITMMLRGERIINVLHIHKLATRFRVNPNYILGLSDDMFLPSTIVDGNQITCPDGTKITIEQ